jgi:uncharacterized protein (DUF2267 family)
MSMTGLDVFDRTLQETNIWLKELMDDLRCEDRQKAYLALRSVLHALRDRLPVHEVVHLGAQLPLLVRGIYYESYQPREKPLPERHLDEFYEHVTAKYFSTGPTDPERITKAVCALLSRHVSQGEIDDVKQSVFAELRRLWDESELERGQTSAAGDRGSQTAESSPRSRRRREDLEAA